MIVLCWAGSARAQTIPGAVIYQANKLVNISGNAGHIAANNLGDAFYVSQTDNIAYWICLAEPPLRFRWLQVLAAVGL